MTNIEDVRAELMSALRELRNHQNPMPVDRARAVAQVAGVLVDTARVEVDYLRVSKRTGSAFLTKPAAVTRKTKTGTVTAFPGGVLQHRLGGDET